MPSLLEEIILRSPPSKLQRLDIRDSNHSAEKMTEGCAAAPSHQNLMDQRLKDLETLDIPFCDPSTSRMTRDSSKGDPNRRRSSLGRGRRASVAPLQSAAVPVEMSQQQISLLQTITDNIAQYEGYKSRLEQEKTIWRELLGNQTNSAEKAESLSNELPGAGKFSLEEKTFLRQRPNYKLLREGMKLKSDAAGASVLSLVNGRRQTESSVVSAQRNLQIASVEVLRGFLPRESFAQLLGQW